VRETHLEHLLVLREQRLELYRNRITEQHGLISEAYPRK
jgi:hypothetical protein